MKHFKTLLVASLLGACACAASFHSSATAIEAQQASLSASQQTSDKINLNTADVNTLMSLPGVGKSKAEAIVAYRTQFGQFKTINDITLVKGIGDKLLAKFSDQISVN
ncbi:ComEA family DNA-binding protein [Alteromonas sediminis]|uniref:ComEA family DNA-binding protein n=1 Tax=Alteromonas sediminis TaxID=2259342 RepID=A0A3N5Y2Y3_9ALTE|nr:ComEA family DNA-binding protein [Alteromonas sediminis]RPJ68317.1 ComEA family DNA-binding protein [Alteromonas sediminis]